MNILDSLLQTFVSLFGCGEFDTIALRQADVGFVALADHENVSQTCSESVTISVLDVNNIERSRMSFPMHNGTDTTGITTSGDHAQISGLEFDGIHDFAGVDVQPDGVVHFDDGVGVTDGAAVRGVQVGHVLWASFDLADTAQLVFGFLIGDPVNGVTSLDIVDEAEIFSSLFNLDDIHETGWESGISSHFAVDLDKPLLHNSAHFLGSQGILQTISQENRNWHRFAQLVGSGAWTTRVNTSKFVQHP